MLRQRSSRVLCTVLFTDVVGSTELARELGDRRWQELLARHHRIVRRELRRFRGREVDTAGDGFFATFDEPDAGTRCACAISDGIRDLGIEVRSGLHAGECELAGGKVRGIAVHIGARVMAAAAPGEVLVSSTLKDLMTGSEIEFEDRGTHELKGVAGEWRLFAITAVHGSERTAPLDAETAARRLAAVQPPPLVPRARLMAIVGILLALSTALVIYMFVRGGNEVRFLSRVPVDSVGRIDPVTNRIVGALDAGSGPTGVAAGQGILWVIRLDAGTLARVNLLTNEVETVSTEGKPTGIAIGEDGSVWVLNGFDHTVIRVDPVRLEIEDRIALPTGTRDLAVGEGAVWVTNGIKGTLERIDPATGFVRTIDLGVNDAEGVAVGGGLVWVVSGQAVVQYDPIAGGVLGMPSLRFTGDEITFGEGSLWITHPSEDSVSRLDPASRRAVVIKVGNGPVALAAGEGVVWVTNSLEGTLSRIDPATNEVTTIEVGQSPEGVTVGGGSVWVAVHRL